MSLPRFALRHKAMVIALITVAMLYGIVKLVSMPRRAAPTFTVRACQVVTRWPGAQTQQVEQRVTHLLEKELYTLEEVDYIRSTTTTGQSVIYVYLEEALPSRLILQAWDRVRAKIDIVRPRLPRGVMDPMVHDDFGDSAVMLLAVYEKAVLRSTARDVNGTDGRDGRIRRGDRYTPRQLEVIAERVRDRIALLPGVSKADLHGAPQEAIYIETPRNRWANLDLTITQLEELLRSRNIDASGGSIDTDRSRLRIHPTGEFDAVEEIHRLVVGRHDSGATIHLQDLGVNVHRGYEDPPRTLTRFGTASGTAPCVIVSFTVQDGQNVTEIGREAKRLLEELQLTPHVIPPDIAVEIVFDEPAHVEKEISHLTHNVSYAMVIVSGIVLLLAGGRAAVVMAATIPFVMVISIGLCASMGVELEHVSIASLIIVLGMLIDNGVVVCDNVRRVSREHATWAQSVAVGIEQVMYPILMGTLTTVFAFLPLAFFVTGAKRDYIFSLPVVVSVTLMTSWVAAVTITVLMVYGWMRPRPGDDPDRAPAVWMVQRLGHLLRRGRSDKPKHTLLGLYGYIVHRCLNAKPLVIGMTGVLLIGVLILPVGSEFFPNDNRDYLYIDVWLPQGSSFEATNREVARVEQILQDLSPIDTQGFSGHRLKRFYSSVGGSGPRFVLGVNPLPPVSNYAQILVQTADPSVTDRYVQAIRTAAEQSIAGARVIPRKLPLGPPIDAPISIRVYGSGLGSVGFANEWELRRQARRVKEVFESTDGMWDIHDVWGDPSYQLDIQIDEDKARLSGTTNASVARTLNAYYSGHPLTTFREGDHQIPVYLRVPAAERTAMDDPRSIFVEGAAGKVPVDTFADVNLSCQTTKIERRKSRRMIEVRARVEPGVLANEKLSQIMPALRQLQATLPTGYWYEIGGTFEKSTETSSEMRTAFGVAVVLIILCLIIQYNCFVKPMVILMTVPMGAIGAFLGLWLTGYPMGFMPMLGLVSLAGMVVNAGILYIEFAETCIKEKLTAKGGLAGEGQKSCCGLTRDAFHRCLVEAGKLRVMPIFLTVSTTVGGLFPLAWFGGPLWAGMAYLLIYGLLVATLLTLFILPAIYASFVEYFGVRTVTLDESPLDWLPPIINAPCRDEGR